MIRPFVWCSLRKFGELVKQYPDDFHPAPEADFVLGGPIEDWNYPEWTQDRHGQIRKGNELKAEGRYLYKLHDVTVLQMPGRTLLMLAPEVMAAEATPSAGLKLPENAAVQIQLTPQDRIGVNIYQEPVAITEAPAPGILYTHDWANNYFHHVMDTFPRNWAAEEGLIPPDAAHVPQAISAIHYDTLYYPSFWPACGYGPNSIAWLRKRLLGNPVKHKQHILYLSRDDAQTRRVTNEGEVIDLLWEFGTVLVVRAGSLTAQQQIGMAKESPLIIGPHGAAMMNSIFATGSTIIEFIPENRQPCCYRYVAKWAGNRYGAIICPAGANDDMTVDLDLLREAMR